MVMLLNQMTLHHRHVAMGLSEEHLVHLKGMDLPIMTSQHNLSLGWMARGYRKQGVQSIYNLSNSYLQVCDE